MEVGNREGGRRFETIGRYIQLERIVKEERNWGNAVKLSEFSVDFSVSFQLESVGKISFVV
jgi:hypothetical protein